MFLSFIIFSFSWCNYYNQGVNIIYVQGDIKFMFVKTFKGHIN